MIPSFIEAEIPSKELIKSRRSPIVLASLTVIVPASEPSEL